MSVLVDVFLMSGKTVTVEASLDEVVATLKRRAQNALTVGSVLDCFGEPLDDMMTVKEETGTSLTLQLCRVQIQATSGAFIAILTDESVVTWGQVRAADSSLSTCFCS